MQLKNSANAAFTDRRSADEDVNGIDNGSAP
jgi:hypothetical protein